MPGAPFVASFLWMASEIQQFQSSPPPSSPRILFVFFLVKHDPPSWCNAREAPVVSRRVGPRNSSRASFRSSPNLVKRSSRRRGASTSEAARPSAQDLRSGGVLHCVGVPFLFFGGSGSEWIRLGSSKVVSEGKGEERLPSSKSLIECLEGVTGV